MCLRTSTLLQVNGSSIKEGSQTSRAKSIFIFFFYPDRVLSLLPASSGNPERFTYRHFASGNFHCFAGLVNPYWGLPEPPPATHPGIHTGARFRTPRIPSVHLSTLLPLAPNNLHSRAPPCRPTDRPLFPAAPQKEKSLRLLVPGRGWVVSTLTGDVTGATRLADAAAVTSHRACSLADTFYRHFYCTPSLIAAEVGDTNRGGSNESVLSRTLALSLLLFLFFSLVSLYLSVSFSSQLYHSLCGSMALPKSTSQNIRSDALTYQPENERKKFTA